MPGGRRAEKAEEPLLAEMGRYAHLGFQLALSTGLFLLVGWWLDSRIGTVPLLTIVGALGGAAAGFYSVVRQVLSEPTRRPGTTDDPEKGEN